MTRPDAPMVPATAELLADDDEVCSVTSSDWTWLDGRDGRAVRCMPPGGAECV